MSLQTAGWRSIRHLGSRIRKTKLKRGARIIKAKPRRGFKVVPKGGAGLSLKTTKARGGRKMAEVENYFAIGTSTRSEISSAHHACYAGADCAIELNPRVDYESRRRNDAELI